MKKYILFKPLIKTRTDGSSYLWNFDIYNEGGKGNDLFRKIADMPRKGKMPISWAQANAIFHEVIDRYMFEEKDVSPLIDILNNIGGVAEFASHLGYWIRLTHDDFIVTEVLPKPFSWAEFWSTP
jgi:hypothetical protein